jgi:hypothetical protein
MWRLSSEVRVDRLALLAAGSIATGMDVTGVRAFVGVA